MGQIFCFYYTNQDKNEIKDSDNQIKASGLKHLLQHGKSFIFQLSGGHCNGIKRPTHLHPQVINHYSVVFLVIIFLLFRFTTCGWFAWESLPRFCTCPVLPHALVTRFPLSINARHTPTVVLKLYFTVTVLLQLLDTWASGVGFYTLLIMDFFPALTSVLSKWLPTCSTLDWKVPLFHTDLQCSLPSVYCHLILSP